MNIPEKLKRLENSKEVVVKSLAVLGAIAIIYVGGYALVTSSKHLSSIGTKISNGADSARIFLAQVFLSSKKVPPEATSTPSIIATSTFTTTIASSTNTLTPTTTTTANSTGAKTSPTRIPTTPGKQTTKIYTPIVTGTVTTSNPNGKPDLVVNILSYGVLDKSTNIYTATTSPVSRANRIAVRFNVTNIGNKTSPIWRFNGTLPTYPAQTFNSDEQAVINPGDKIEYTMGFDQLMDTATATVKIDLDPSLLINESDETNNSASINIPVLRN